MDITNGFPAVRLAGVDEVAIVVAELVIDGDVRVR
jgi:hypothetical protein